MIIFQVLAVTMRKAKSRSLHFINRRQVRHTQNANTDSGHLPQGVARKGRERRTETDIGRATESETGIETETEIETATGEEKGMTGMEGEGMTGIEGKTGTGTEAERMTEAEARGTRTEVIGTRGETGAPEKERGTRMAKGRRGGPQMKINGEKRIGKERRREGRIERRRQHRGNGKILKRERRRRMNRNRKAKIMGKRRRRSASLRSAARIRLCARRETGTWPGKLHAQPPRATLRKKRTEQIPLILLFRVLISKIR